MNRSTKSFPMGTTLIEALVLLFVFSVVTVSFAQAWSVGTQLIFETRNRLGAASLAAEKMEIIRNLKYADVGTKTSNGSGGWEYGIPGGEILQDETLTVNNRTYQVHTFVQYIDDPFDGLVNGSPPDAVPNDYKKAFVTVSWGKGGPTQRVEESSIIVPQGVEQSAGGGVLSINVLEQPGTGLSGATVHIVNTQTTPTINVTATTDSGGNLTLPAAPASLQSYAISVEKTGYFPSTTYPPVSSGGSFTPLETHASVVANALNQVTLVTNKVANLTLRTKDTFGADVPNVSMHIVGGKQIGTSPTTFVFDQTVSSGATASFAMANASPGAYTVTPTVNHFVFLRMDPAETASDTILLNPDQTKTTTLTFASTAIGSLLAQVNRQSDNAAIEGATVRLTNATTGYDTTVTTDHFGRAYFPTAAPALTAGSYALDISAPGFATETATVDIANSLVQSTFTLNAL